MAGLNLFTNNASTTLASNVLVGATSLTVATGYGSLFPALAGSQYFFCTLTNAAATIVEIVKVTARVSDTFTIVRGQDNTSAQAWSAGDKVELRLTAADLQNFPQLDSTNTFAAAQTFSATPVFSAGITSTATPVSVASGGTGLGTLTANNVILGNGASAPNFVAPGTAGNVLSSNGTTWTSTAPASGARSGTSYATLSSGTPNITLTSASNQVQIVTSDAAGQSITLPAMTTLTTGAGYFVFYNTSIYPVALKDAGGTIREYLLPSQSNVTNTLSPIQGASLVIEDISTSNGVWHCQNPTAVVTSNNFTYTPTTVTPPATTVYVSFVSHIGANYYLFIATSSTNLRACLGTLNTTTGVFTFGTFTNLSTSPTNGNLQQYSADSNGSDRGLLTLVHGVNQVGTPAAYSAFGYAVVSGTLYFSSASTWSGVTAGSSGGFSRGLSESYAGSNNAFLVASSYYSSTTYGLRVGGFTVGVSGTTVTLTAATGTYTTTNTSSDQYSATLTSATTVAMDRNTSTASPAFASYNTSTNVITSGTRTSQTSKIAGNLLPNILDSNASDYYTNCSSRWIFTSSGGKVLSANLAAVVTNPGAATLTVATTTYSLKSYSSKSYTTISPSRAVYIKYVYIASASVGYAYDSANNLWYTFDPSNSNLNFNYGSASLGPSASNYSFISSTQFAPLSLTGTGTAGDNSTISIDIATFATPFIS